MRVSVLYDVKLVTVEPAYYGYLGTNQKSPNYRGVLIFQIILYCKTQFGTSTKYLNYAGVLIFECTHK